MKKYYNFQLKKTVSVNSLKTLERLKLDKKFTFPAEKHNFHELLFVIDGNVLCRNGLGVETVSSGYVKLINPETEHSYSTDGKAEIFIICFKCISGVLDILNENTLLSEDNLVLMQKLIDEAENSFTFPFNEKLVPKTNSPIGAQQLIENMIEELLIKLLREKINGLNITIVNNDDELKEKIINDVIYALQDSVCGKISLDDLCKKTFYSKTYLNTLFKKSKHCTIIKYYNRLKIEESKKMLQKGKRVSEIAELLNFDSPNYFSKAFKNVTGKTPMEYKKSII